MRKYYFDGKTLVDNQKARGVRGNTCRGLGDTSGQAPEARWLPHAGRHTEVGTPIQWINEKLVCDCFNAEYKSDSDAGRIKATDGSACCSADGSDWLTVCKPGCERFQFISGMDEMMLNSDMGLYLNFTSDANNIPVGCSGLENFTPQKWGSIPNGTFNWTFTWSVDAAAERIEPQCVKNDFADPPGSFSMSEVIDEYANNNTKFLEDFIPTLEKMLKNGYTSSELHSTQSIPYNCTFVNDLLAVDRSYTC